MMILDYHKINSISITGKYVCGTLETYAYTTPTSHMEMPSETVDY